MLITLEEMKKRIIFKIESLNAAEIEGYGYILDVGDGSIVDVENDGSIIIRTNLYSWASDGGQIHDEREPKELFNAWLNNGQ